MAHSGYAFENAHCVGETLLALQIALPTKTIWVPKSVVHDDSEINADGHSGRLVLKRWFVEKECLEDDADTEVEG